MNILFVCTGNTCRSVMAERWLRRRLAEKGLGWEVRSAGVAADPQGWVPDTLRDVLAEAGLERDFQHRPARLDRALTAWADRILVMEQSHKAVIERQFPEAAGKTELLRSAAKLPGPAEVPDPIGGEPAVYRRTFQVIAEAVDALLP